MSKEKDRNVLQKVRACLDKGNYILTKHAIERKNQRLVPLPDIMHVLYNGRHEEIKDSWQEKYDAWNYAIRGFSKDKRDIRVVVSFERNNMLIITVIQLK